MSKAEDLASDCQSTRRATMIDEQRLRELAKVATPGPWTYYADDNIISSESQPTAIIALAYRSVHCTVEQRIANGTFAAAANPAAILALLDELATLRQERIKELENDRNYWRERAYSLEDQLEWGPLPKDREA